MDGTGTDHWMLVEQVLRHLDRLLHLWTMGDVATSATLLAGWAVLLALEDMDGTMATMVRSTARRGGSTSVCVRRRCSLADRLTGRRAGPVLAGSGPHTGGFKGAPKW
jgi:hypothetical protein